MLLEARHATRYRYSSPVFCEPLVVRLRPRDDASQRLLSYSLTIAPEPAHLSQHLDLEGNVVSEARFGELIESLAITVSWQVETLRANPFDFLLQAGAERLPLAPTEAEKPLWPMYGTSLEPHERVMELAHQVACLSRHGSVEFLCRLAGRINQTHEKIVRHDGPPWSPAETLSRGTGSCRDLAWLFIEACRAMRIPARFVSGYALGDDPAAERHLHAWAEAYLPGAGWRGFDPMSGLAICDQYVAVAASRIPEGAAPTAGSFRSNTATCTLEVEVEIEEASLSANGEMRPTDSILEPEEVRGLAVM
jgi:transglutaminase-like putative cysteine protease